MSIRNRNVKREWKNHFISALDFTGARKITTASPVTQGSYVDATAIVGEINSTGIPGIKFPGGKDAAGFSIRSYMPLPHDMDTGHPVYARVHWTSGSQAGEYNYTITVTVNASDTIAAGSLFYCARTKAYYTLNSEITRVGAGTISGQITAVVHATGSVLVPADVLLPVFTDSKITGTVVATVVTAASATWKLWLKARSPNNDVLTGTIDTALGTVIPVDEVPTNTQYTIAITSPGKIAANTITRLNVMEIALELDAAAAGLTEDIFALGVELLYLPLVSPELGQTPVTALPSDWV